MRRIPFWLALAPLVVGIAGYWLVWNQFANQFAADLTRAIPGEPIKVGGFPYRLEAEFDSLQIKIGASPINVVFGTGRMAFNRGPWQPELTVLRSTDTVIDAQIENVAGARLTGQASTAQGSLRLREGRIARASLVLGQAKLKFTGFRREIFASELQIHLRQPVLHENIAESPRYPAQFEGAASAKEMRFGAGSPVALAANFTVNGRIRPRRYSDWSDGGTVEIAQLKLADPTGVVLDASATVAPDKSRTLQINGSLTTVCPDTIRAVFSGTPSPAEMRLRAPVLLAFSGDATGLAITSPTEDLAGRSRRRQLAPCPTLGR